MAWVLLLLENAGQDKRVESILVPCLDAGSIPATSTKKSNLFGYFKKKQYLCTEFDALCTSSMNIQPYGCGCDAVAKVL